MLLHQLIQVLLVLLHPLQEVHLLVVQQSQLLIYLEDKIRQLQMDVRFQYVQFKSIDFSELYIISLHSKSVKRITM